VSHIVVEITEATAQLVADKLNPYLVNADAPVSTRATPEEVAGIVLTGQPRGTVS
jgi:hypothetical protein